MNRILLFILLFAVAGLAFFKIYFSIKQKKQENEERQALYVQGLKPVYNKDNDFCPEAQLAFFDSLINSHTITEDQQNLAEYFRAMNYLKEGKERNAIPILDSLMGAAKNTNDIKLFQDARRYLALTYLRLGERNNCVSNHTTQSCIFPISGSGVYTDPTYSRKGIDLYENMLREDSTDLESRWLLNIAYMTTGGYPDQLPRRWLIPGLNTDSNVYQVKPFQDMAGALRLNRNMNMGGGTIIDDFNNDGYFDIVTSGWGLEESMHYYRNNKDGTFSDVSAMSGLDKIKGGLNIIQADYNNDGYTDIFVLRGAWLMEFGKQPATLLKNNGNGTFTDVTISSGLLSFGPTQTGVWGDFNNDGWLDIFIGHETVNPEHPHPSQLFVSNRDGTFTEVAAAAGCELTGFIKGVTSADYNKDGWQDIFVSTLDGRKILLKNKGVKSNIPQFEDAAHEANLDLNSAHTFPTWFWDYDNDGWPDIFICSYEFTGSQSKVIAAHVLNVPVDNNSQMYLFRNNHDGSFTNVSREVGLNRPAFAMGSNFGDIDNDGWLDFYLGTGNPDFRSLIPDKMYKNIDGKKFVDITSSARVGNLQKGHGIAFADLDNDGDQDVFIETGGAYPGDAYYNSFYVNPGQNENNWISVQLEGVQSNRSAIGSHIEVSFTENGKQRKVYRDINSGGSFGSSPLQKEIGIGSATLIDTLKITWPASGLVQSFKNIRPRQFLRIKEGVDQITYMDIKAVDFQNPNFKPNIIDCSPIVSR